MEVKKYILRIIRFKNPKISNIINKTLALSTIINDKKLFKEESLQFNLDLID